MVSFKSWTFCLALIVGCLQTLIKKKNCLGYFNRVKAKSKILENQTYVILQAKARRSRSFLWQYNRVCGR